MSDYWTHTTVAEHEAKVREINERFIAGKLSRSDVQTEIANLFGVTPEEKEIEQLEAQINEGISEKMKATLSVEAYFNLREKIRSKILDAPREEAKKLAEEEARQEGTCLSCGAKCNSKGAEWFCQKCNLRFRKH